MYPKTDSSPLVDVIDLSAFPEALREVLRPIAEAAQQPFLRKKFAKLLSRCKASIAQLKRDGATNEELATLLFALGVTTRTGGRLAQGTVSKAIWRLEHPEGADKALREAPKDSIPNAGRQDRRSPDAHGAQGGSLSEQLQPCPPDAASALVPPGAVPDQRTMRMAMLLATLNHKEE
jgi:hypothetical protein